MEVVPEDRDREGSIPEIISTPSGGWCGRLLAGGSALGLMLGLFSVASADAPAFDEIGLVTVPERRTVSLDLNDFASNPQHNDALVFVVDGLPSYAAFDQATGVITFSPRLGDAHADPHTVTVTAYKDVGFNRVPGGITPLWSEQEGQTTGHLPDRNRVLAGRQLAAGSVGRATAVGSGGPTGGSTAPSERNRSTFTVVLAPAGGSAPQFVGAASAADVTASSRFLMIDKPSGVQSGDFLLAHVRYRDHEEQNGGNNAPNLTAEGWTVLHTIDGPSQANHTVLWRFVGGKDPSSYEFNENDPTGRMAGGIVAYRGVDPADPIQEWAFAEPSESLVAPGVEFGSAETAVVRLWAWHGYSASRPGEPPSLPVSPSATTTFGVRASQNFFLDDDGHLFEGDINAIASAGITRGCNPPVNDRFCPDDTVTRGQMAAFLVRALGYTDDGGGDRFTDDDHSVFEGDIDRLATAGVTRGCNPPANDRFCPDEAVTRGQMAAFLVRALGYADDGGGDLFTDDDHSVFEGDIDRLATAGVTRGCNPPTNDRFCPNDELTRGQMAAFLARALIYDG